jgi:hypothetical protein
MSDIAPTPVAEEIAVPCRDTRSSPSDDLRVPEASLQSRFELLADKWERETRNLSSIGAITSHPDHAKIIDLDSSVIPLILERMKTQPWFWFRALQELSGEENDPVTREMQGDLCAMTEAWLKWGARRGRNLYRSATDVM